ncbi:MAG: hypothetical protein IPM48_06670 [Saprospiraceae bacterium]|nr:hypothetical protein [Saprospiraceae bacterium]
MKKSEIQVQIEAYLDKQMNAEEARQFENRLKSSSELKKEYTAALFERLAGDSHKDEAQRNWLREVYQSGTAVELGQKPSSGTIQFRSNWIRMAAAAAVLLGVVYFTGIFDQSSGSTSVEFASMMIEPIGMERASVAEMSISEKASNFYFRNPPATDSLEKMTIGCNGLCVAKYYLAHAYLKTKQFEKAKSLFSDLESNIDQLQTIPQLQGRENELRINSALAQAATGEKKEEVLSKLNKLIAEMDSSDTLRTLAVRLIKILD